MTARGRRPGPSGETREAILSAARAQFAREGYAAASLRGIARHAGVDPALIHHYFGDKRGLYAEAVRPGTDLGEVVEQVLEPTLAAPAAQRGEVLLRTFVEYWDVPENADTATAMLRAALESGPAVSPQQDLISTLVVREVVAHHAGSPEAARRAVSLISVQMVGLAVTRLLLRLPEVEQAATDEVVAMIAPQVQRALDDAATARS